MSVDRGISPGAGKSTRRHRKQKRMFRDQCEDRDAVCWLCTQPIDYTLGPEHPDSFSLDHMYPRSSHPQLAEDMGNYRPSHLDCNKRRGDRAPRLTLGITSEEW